MHRGCKMPLVICILSFPVDVIWNQTEQLLTVWSPIAVSISTHLFLSNTSAFDLMDVEPMSHDKPIKFISNRFPTPCLRT